LFKSKIPSVLEQSSLVGLSVPENLIKLTERKTAFRSQHCLSVDPVQNCDPGFPYLLQSLVSFCNFSGYLHIFSFSVLSICVEVECVILKMGAKKGDMIKSVLTSQMDPGAPKAVPLKPK